MSQLGKKLIDEGLITEKLLEQGLMHQQTDRILLGEALLEVLRKAIKRQVQAAGVEFDPAEPTLDPHGG